MFNLWDYIGSGTAGDPSGKGRLYVYRVEKCRLTDAIRTLWWRVVKQGEGRRSWRVPPPNLNN